MYGCSNTTCEGVAVVGVGGGGFLSRRIRAACKHLTHVTHFLLPCDGFISRREMVTIDLNSSTNRTQLYFGGRRVVSLSASSTLDYTCRGLSHKTLPFGWVCVLWSQAQSLLMELAWERGRDSKALSLAGISSLGIPGWRPSPPLKLENMTDTLSLLSLDP